MERTLLIAVVVLGFAAGTVAPVTTAGAATEPDAMAADELASQADDPALPPGLNESGVIDAMALLDAHRATLENTSYTTTVTSAVRNPNGTLLRGATTTYRVASGGDSYLATTTQVSATVTGTQVSANATDSLGVDRVRLEVWANATDAVVARAGPGNLTRFRQAERASAPMSPTTGWGRLYGALGTMDTEYVGSVERDGTTLHRVVTTTPTDEAASGLASNFTALVDEDGVVRAFQATERRTVEGEEVLVTRTIRVTRLGDTTVERPVWYDRAVENESEGGAE